MRTLGSETYMERFEALLRGSEEEAFAKLRALRDEHQGYVCLRYSCPMQFLDDLGYCLALTDFEEGTKTRTSCTRPDLRRLAIALLQ